MRFPTLCLSRNFLILGLCLLRWSSSSKNGRQHGLFVYRVGGGGVGSFRGFLLLFLLCLPREVVDFLCCALFWAGAACDVCSCCRCVWQSLFSLVLMLLIMLIVLGVGIVSCRLACLPKRCGVAGSYSICNWIGVCKCICMYVCMYIWLVVASLLPCGHIVCIAHPNWLLLIIAVVVVSAVVVVCRRTRKYVDVVRSPELFRAAWAAVSASHR